MAENFTFIDHPQQTEQIPISQKSKADHFCIDTMINRTFPADPLMPNSQTHARTQ
jgi:hypothetical protein